MSVVGAALARSRHDDKNKAHQNVFCKPAHAHSSATDVGGYGIVSYGGAAGGLGGILVARQRIGGCI
jgi:hypothetical protein